MSELFPLNCPKCGAHDYGLFAASLQDCPHCLRARLAEAEALLREGCGYIDDVPDRRSAYKDRVRAFLAPDSATHREDGSHG